jgi:hypothetical protein
VISLKKPLLSLPFLLFAAAVLGLTGCELLEPPAEPAEAEMSGEWWEVSWGEIVETRPASMALSDGTVVAATSIRQGTNADDELVWMKAKGNVILQTAGTKPIRARAFRLDYEDGTLFLEGRPTAVQGTTRLVAADDLTVIRISEGQLAVEGPSRLEAVEKGPPQLQATAPPAPEPMSLTPEVAPKPKPKPQVSPAKKVEAPEPKRQAPAPAPAPVKPKAEPPPQPKLPQMRLPDDFDLPGLDPGA